MPPAAQNFSRCRVTCCGFKWKALLVICASGILVGAAFHTDVRGLVSRGIHISLQLFNVWYSKLFRHTVNEKDLAALNHSLPYWIPLWIINKPTGVIDARFPAISVLDQDASHILPLLDNLKESKFFRVFKTNLEEQCPFWSRREMCGSGGSCQICQCDESQIPASWKVTPIKNFVDRGSVELWQENDLSSDMDDESADYISHFERRHFGINLPAKPPSVSYVDLTLNRPGYTAYRGRNIWGLIYNENCMNSVNPGKSLSNGRIECTEEEAFYKIISGMQTVIMVLSAEYYFSSKTPEIQSVEMEELNKAGRIVDAASFRAQYSPDLALFKDRVAVSRDWVANLYFTFGVLLKTWCNIVPILETCDCDTGSPDDDAAARLKLRSLLADRFHVCGDEFRQQPLFRRKQSVALRQFANISRIMDCLECDKCRLHGKIKILALRLAIKASGSETKLRKVERNELIALVSALEYFADGIVALHRFDSRLSRLRWMWVTSGSVIVLSIWAFKHSKLKSRATRTANAAGDETLTTTSVDDFDHLSSPKLTKRAK